MQSRYLVEWTPWKTVCAAAVKAGWDKVGTGLSANDFVDVDDFTVDEEFPTFTAALKRARMVDILDTWNCPRIYRQQLVENDHDDLGNRVRAMPSWESDALWEVFEDGADPVESAPDNDLL